MEESENSNTINTRSGFSPGYNDGESMQIRLNTEAIKMKVYLYLKGYYEDITVNEEKNTVEKNLKQIGQPKVNDVGLQAVMLFLDQTINAMTVQGNRDREDYGMLMFRFRKYLARDLWINMYAYGIKESEYDGIIDSISLFAEPFFSRLIDNEERKSYGQSWVQSDSNTVRASAQKKRFLDYIPFIGGGQG